MGFFDLFTVVLVINNKLSIAYANYSTRSY